MPYNRVQFGKLCGKHTKTVERWIDEGMPAEKHGGKYVIELETALPWLCERSKAPAGSARERLAQVQAERVELDNEKERKNLLRLDHVTDIMTSAVAQLASQLDGVAGRVANDLSSETNPAVIRQIVLDEHHRVRSAYADALQKLFESPVSKPKPDKEKPKRKAKAKRKANAKRS